MDWEENYLRTSARALPHILSDHVPILLDTGEVSMCPSIFRFENIWLSHDQYDPFDSDVRQSLSSLTLITGDSSGRLVLKL